METLFHQRLNLPYLNSVIFLSKISAFLLTSLIHLDTPQSSFLMILGILFFLVLDKNDIEVADYAENYDKGTIHYMRTKAASE